MCMLEVALTAIVSAAAAYCAFKLFHASHSDTAAPPTQRCTAQVAHPVITDLAVHTFPSAVSPSSSPPGCDADLQWRRIDKDLYQHQHSGNTAWLYVRTANAEELTSKDQLVVDIKTDERSLYGSSDGSWHCAGGGVWMRKSEFAGNIDQVVTDVDALFGEDAVDPRPRWRLMPEPLQLDYQHDELFARLTVLRGRDKPSPDCRMPLRARIDGNFKILQISDLHMGTGVGVCNDAIDADGNKLPESEADPLTVKFIRQKLKLENPDLVVLTGDQLHHHISDSQTALFKVLAPIIKHETPFAAIFGNHDDEGPHALSRTAQMSILQSLPYNLSEPGPEEVDGVGNFCIQVLAAAPLQFPVLNLYFLDSHGEIQSKILSKILSKIPSKVLSKILDKVLSTIFRSGYDHIRWSQIRWFEDTAQEQRLEDSQNNRKSLSLAFQHIPLPEFGNDCHLDIRSGQRREPTEGPRHNSHLYDSFAREGIEVIGCGHDHMNYFCALKRQRTRQDGDKDERCFPWMCHAGASGYGAYCSYAGKAIHRRMRIYDVDTTAGSISTWLQTEYSEERVDELVLVEGEAVVDQPEEALY